MILVYLILAAIILVWLSWPRIQQLNFDRALMQEHRRRDRTPMPRYYDSVVVWESYFRAIPNPTVGVLRIELAFCVDDAGNPLPEYQPIYDLITNRMTELGYRVTFDPVQHSFEWFANS